MEDDAATNVQAETDADDTVAEDELLAVKKGQDITDGSSNT